MREYVDFLGRQSPYDALEASDRDALARLIEVEYFVAGTTITAAQVFLALAARLACRGYRTARDFVDLTAGDDLLHR